MDASAAAGGAASCGCASRTLGGSKFAVDHLHDELRLRASLSIVALAPSSLTAPRCPQLKQVVRRCPRLLVSASARAVRSPSPASLCSACLVLSPASSSSSSSSSPSSSSPSLSSSSSSSSKSTSSSTKSSSTLKCFILLLFGVSCRDNFFHCGDAICHARICKKCCVRVYHFCARASPAQVENMMNPMQQQQMMQQMMQQHQPETVPLFLSAPSEFRMIAKFQRGHHVSDALSQSILWWSSPSNQPYFAWQEVVSGTCR